MTPQRRFALITGGSSGIGFALAKVFARNGYGIIIVARKAEELERAQQELRKEYNAEVITMQADLSVPSQVQNIFDQCKQQNLPVEVLVNNAGFGNYGKFADIALEKHLQMIDLNIRALTQLTGLFLSQFLQANKGGILNVASTAAFQPGPLMATYYASKAYVLSFSQALRSEVAGRNIHVTALCPGATKTNFQNLEKGFSNTRLIKNGGMMSAEAVAEVGFAALEKNKSVAIPGFANKLLAFSTRLGPRNLVTALSRWVLEK